MNHELPPEAKKVTLLVVILLAAFTFIYGIITSQSAGFGIDGVTLVIFAPILIGVALLIGLALFVAHLFRLNHQIAQSKSPQGLKAPIIAVFLTIILIAAAAGTYWLLKSPPVGP
jgi:hypothetical protein